VPNVEPTRAKRNAIIAAGRLAPLRYNRRQVRLCFLAEERKLSGPTFDVTLGAERRTNAGKTNRRNRSRAARAAPLQTATSAPKNLREVNCNHCLQIT